MRKFLTWEYGHEQDGVRVSSRRSWQNIGYVSWLKATTVVAFNITGYKRIYALQPRGLSQGRVDVL